MVLTSRVRRARDRPAHDPAATAAPTGPADPVPDGADGPIAHGAAAAARAPTARQAPDESVPRSTDWRTITLSSLPVLLGAVVIGVFAGQILAYYQDRLLAIPVLLALVPAVNGIGGNVGSILGSRVASGLHFGGLWSNRGRGFRNDIVASLVLAIVSFTFLGVFAHVAGPLLGLPVTVTLPRLAATTLLAGGGLIVVMALLVTVVGMLSHRYGWDPDNVVVPVLTTAGDTLGIVFLLLAGEVVGL